MIDQWPDDEIEVVLEFCRTHLGHWPSSAKYLDANWSEFSAEGDPRLSLIGTLSYHRDFDAFISKLESSEVWGGVERVAIMSPLELDQLERVLVSPVLATCDAFTMGYHSPGFE